jgi:hypothetical protein
MKKWLPVETLRALAWSASKGYLPARSILWWISISKITLSESLWRKPERQSMKSESRKHFIDILQAAEEIQSFVEKITHLLNS